MENKELWALEGALRFYAKDSFYRGTGMHMCGHSSDSQITLDRGKKAKAALGGEHGG